MKVKYNIVFFSAILFIVLLLALAVPCIASDQLQSGNYQSSASVVSLFTRTSSASGHVFIHSVCAAPSKIVSTVTLESADEGSADYTQAYRLIKKTVYNSTAITQMMDYPLENGKNYRIKVEITDTCNGLTTTATTYRNLTES